MSDETHTVLLLQYGSEEATRTYMEFDTTAAAAEGAALRVCTAR
jgi:hypothetical protein